MTSSKSYEFLQYDLKIIPVLYLQYKGPQRTERSPTRLNQHPHLPPFCPKHARWPGKHENSLLLLYNRVSLPSPSTSVAIFPIGLSNTFLLTTRLLQILFPYSPAASELPSQLSLSSVCNPPPWIVPILVSFSKRLVSQ